MSKINDDERAYSLMIEGIESTTESREAVNRATEELWKEL